MGHRNPRARPCSSRAPRLIGVTNRMRLKKLLRKDIEPRCTYCAHGAPLADGERIACRRRGVVDGTSHCRAFRYDPLRRIPRPPANPSQKKFTKEDFEL